MTFRPISAFFMLPLILVLLELGRRFRNRQKAPSESPAIEGAVFALFGLLLAFTFSGAVTPVNEAMSVTVHFKNTSTNKITSLEYEMGAVIPELGDYIVSPFNADRIALVSEVTGDGKRNPFSVLCDE
jgi:hypothetical protein